jgi:pentose-5-phosphate-3-epimerase
MQVYPAILTDSAARVEQQVQLAQNLEPIQVVQIDVIDGLFADNMTVTPADLTAIDFADLKIDFHLMVEEPINYVHEILTYQERLPVRAIIGQVERMSNQLDFLQLIAKHELKAGLSLDLFTPLAAVKPKAWAKLDIMQIMTVRTGHQGQKFNQEAVSKIKAVREHSNQLELIVDGGIRLSHQQLLQDLAVDGAAIGSLLWSAQDQSARFKIVNNFFQSTD